MRKFGDSNFNLKPSIHPSIKDIIWSAGFYEGEGSCRFARGSISLRKNRNINQWCLSGSRARGFLMTIFILLSEKRKNQIKKAFEKDRNFYCEN